MKPHGPGVCAICCTGIEDQYDVCFPCRKYGQAVGALVPLTPISYSASDSQIYQTLRRYKWDGSAAPQQRLRLAGLLGMFLSAHGSCVAPDGIDLITVVESLGSRPGTHPLTSVLRMIEPLNERVVEILGPGPGMHRVDRRNTSADAYLCRDDRVAGARVLLVDDTYTTGAHLQAAAAALRQAGAANVAAVAVGRHMQRNWDESKPLLAWSAEPANRWDPNRCIHCW